MELFKLTGSVMVDTDKAEKSLQKVDNHGESVGKTLVNCGKKAAQWGAAIVTAGAGAVTALVGVASSTAQQADEIDKMSQKLGLSRDAYQEWDYVLSQAGVDINSMQTGLKTLTNRFDDAKNGSAGAVEMFEKLGISAEQLQNMSREDVFEAAIAGFQGMADSTERAALANDLFGKSGQELTPLFNESVESTEALKQQFEDLGIAMSDEAIDAGVEFTDTLDTLKRSFESVGGQIGSAVMPIITDVMNLIVEAMPTIKAIVEELLPPIKDLMSSLLPMFMDFVDTILPILTDLLKDVIPIITKLCEKLLPVIMRIIQTIMPPLLKIVDIVLPLVLNLLDPLIDLLTPLLELLEPLFEIIIAILEPVTELLNLILPPLIELITKIVSALTSVLVPALKIVANFLSVTLKGAVDKIKSVFTAMVTHFTTVSAKVKSVFNSMKSGVLSIFNSMWSGIKGVINWILGGIESMANGVIRGINKLLGGLQTLGGAVGDAIGIDISVPTIPEISLPRLAKGGVIASAGSAIVGEDGAELLELPQGSRVTPLNDNNNAFVDMSEKLDALQNAFYALANAISGVNPQLVLDTGVLVGSIAPKMDAELGKLNTKRARGR